MSGSNVRRHGWASLPRIAGIPKESQMVSQSTHPRIFGLFIASLIAICACSSVKVVPVEASDRCTEGLRFYRPRPYVAVKQPFVIGGGEVFVYGTVDGGKITSIDVRHVPDHIRGAFGFDVSKGDIAAAVDGGRVIARLAQPPELTTHSAETALSGGSSPSPASPTEAPPSATSTEVAARGSGSAKAVTGGNPSTSPLVAVNTLFDIIYLPDFDEQYAIQVDAGLGSASADLSLEQGWMLERASLSMDNRALGEFIFKQIDKATDLAAGLVKQRFLAPSSDQAPLSEHSLDGMQGQRVLMKASYLIETQPGLYPILKPNEKRHSYHHDPHVDSVTKPFYVETPFRPYTVIAWNVLRLARLELVSMEPTGQTTAPPPTALDPEVVTMKVRAGLTLALQDLAAADTGLKTLNVDDVQIAEISTSTRTLTLTLARGKDARAWNDFLSTPSHLKAVIASLGDLAVHVGVAKAQLPE